MATRIVGKGSALRIFIKAASWRVFATCDTILLSFIVTGHIGKALQIGISEVFTKIGLFYLHERYLWENIRFGRIYAEDKKTVLGEKHYRSILKGMSWRIFGTVDTILLAIFWTHNYKAAFVIGTTEVITKVGLFWLHERAWFRIRWGQVKHAEEKASQAPVVAIGNSVAEKNAAVV